jgi:hypothetical protein
MPEFQHSLIGLVWEMEIADTAAFMFAALLVGSFLIALHVSLHIAGLLSLTFPDHQNSLLFLCVFFINILKESYLAF